MLLKRFDPVGCELGFGISLSLGGVVGVSVTDEYCTPGFTELLMKDGNWTRYPGALGEKVGSGFDL